MKLSIFGTILRMFRSSFLAFIIAVLSSSIVSAGTISELSKQTDVSRLEFAMFKIEQDLKEEFKDYNSLADFSLGLYKNEIETDYEFQIFANEDAIFIGLVINEDLYCGDIETYFDDKTTKEYVGLKIDKIARSIMVFFGHFGKYEETTIFGRNMVHLRVAELFGFENFGKVDETNMEQARTVSEVIKVTILAKYCTTGSNYASKLRHTYPLNADAGQSKSISEM